jgi:hypothetical protein
VYLIEVCPIVVHLIGFQYLLRNYKAIGSNRKKGRIHIKPYCMYTDCERGSEILNNVLQHLVTKHPGYKEAAGKTKDLLTDTVVPRCTV